MLYPLGTKARGRPPTGLLLLRINIESVWGMTAVGPIPGIGARPRALNGNLDENECKIINIVISR